MSRLSDAALFYGGRVEPAATVHDDDAFEAPEDLSPDGEPHTSAEERDDDATVMYSDPKAIASGYASWLRDSVNQLGDVTGMDSSARAAHIEASAMAYHDARIPAEQAVTIHNLIAQHSITPPEPDVVDGWAREAMTAVRAKYGDEAPRRLAAAKAFVAARPDLLEILTRTGMGSHPRVVSALTENADRFKRPRRSAR